MASERTGAYIWVTWITGLLAGDQHCEWAAWFRAHYTNYARIPSSFDLNIWKADHGKMLHERAKSLISQGYTVTIEGQNKFLMTGEAATLSGTPDIVAIKDGAALVVDCKTGQRKSADQFQVLTYMLVLPLTHPACLNRTLSGEIQYKDGSVPIGPERLTEAVKSLITDTIKSVGRSAPLIKAPSFDECRFCDITRSDCPDRIDELPQAISAGGLF